MSFRLKTILGIAVIEFIVMALLIVMNQFNFGGTASAQLFDRAQTTARLFSTMVSDAVISTDLATLDSMVESTLTNDELIYLRVLDPRGTVMARGGDEDALAESFIEDTHFDEALTDHRIDIRRVIRIAGQDFGSVELGVSTNSVEQDIATAVRWNAMGAGIGMLLVAGFGYLLGSILTRQLSVLRDGAMALEAGDLEVRVPVQGRDELGQTAECFNRMADALSADRSALLDRQTILLEKRDRTEDIVQCMRDIAGGERVSAIPSLDRKDELGEMARATEVFRNVMDEIVRVRNEQDRLIKAFDRLEEEVVIFGTDGKMLFSNLAFQAGNQAILRAIPEAFTRKLFVSKGIELEEFPDLVGPGGAEERTRFDRMLAGNGAACEVSRKGGRRLMMSSTHVEGVGTIVTASDVTDLRESQAQLIHASKLATLGEMAAGMAHELNQPLGVIRMAAANCQRRIARDKADPEYLDGKLERIIGQTERAAQIIDHMRIFGRKEDDRSTSFDIVTAVTSATGMMRAQLSGSAVSITEDIALNSAMTDGPRVMFEQVIVNLIANARDAITGNAGETADPSGEIAVRVALNDEGACVIDVSDTGGGIPEHLIERLYEPFFTTKEPGKGTGLGLSISYSIIRQMEGAITVENTDVGARFTLVVPLRKAGS